MSVLGHAIPIRRLWVRYRLLLASNSSLLKEAEAALRGTRSPGFSERLRGVLAPPEQSWIAVLVPCGLLGVTLLAGWVLHGGSPVAFEGFAPSNVNTSFATLWQVHSAVVALSIPLLILLIEQSRTSSVVATSIGQVLVVRTRIVFVMSLSLGSVVTIGASAIYLESDAVLLLNFAVSAACVISILVSYYNALSLLLSPTRLRAESQRVLELRLERSMRAAFLLRWMDRRLAELTAEWNVQPLRPRLGESEHVAIARSSRAGRLVDVRHRELANLLRMHVPATADSSVQAGNATDVEPNLPPIRITLPTFGQRVLAGDILVTVNREVSTSVLVAISSVFVVEADRDV